jgi:uncharacterized protein YndB with AHSA1/START domain
VNSIWQTSVAPSTASRASSVEHVQTRDGRLRVWTTLRGVAPDVVFSYWTDAPKLTQWWPQEATLEAVPGGHYTFAFPKVGHTLGGTFSEVVPGKRLAFSWNWHHEPDTGQHVVVDFEKRDEDTLLTLTHGPANPEEQQGHLEGWEHFLGRLKDLLKRP